MLLQLNCRIGIDHIAVIFGQFVMHMSVHMGKQVAVLVNCPKLALLSDFGGCWRLYLKKFGLFLHPKTLYLDLMKTLLLNVVFDFLT